MTTATRTAKAIKVAKLHRHENGVIHALSSDGQRCYTISLGSTTSCTCIAGQNGRHCYHIQTALNRYGNAGFFRPVAPARTTPDDVSDLYN